MTWKPYIQSWLDKWVLKMYEADEKDDYWLTDLKVWIMHLFEKSIDPIHKFIMKKTKEPIPTSSIQIATSLSNIFGIICNTEAGFKIGQDR